MVTIKIMGYDTDYNGIFTFTSELKASELAHLKKFLGQDCREHADWDTADLTWINLEFTPEFDGIQWDGSEKSYDMAEKINFLIREMRKIKPDFGLDGSFLCQGEDITDRYEIIVGDDGFVAERQIEEMLEKIKCPYCEKIITL